jgi:hypothetical protein
MRNFEQVASYRRSQSSQLDLFPSSACFPSHSMTVFRLKMGFTVRTAHHSLIFSLARGGFVRQYLFENAQKVSLFQHLKTGRRIAIGNSTIPQVVAVRKAKRIL